MADWKILPFDHSFVRDGFNSGEPLLDDWLKQMANQWQKKNLAVTYVLVRGDSQQILGYYSLSNSQLPNQDLPDEDRKGKPCQIGVPAILIGRLAVDQTVQGEGHGRHLLYDALVRADTLSSQTGVALVEVHALHERAKSFYLNYGFRALADHPNHLFLSMKQIRRFIVESDES